MLYLLVLAWRSPFWKPTAHQAVVRPRSSTRGIALMLGRHLLPALAETQRTGSRALMAKHNPDHPIMRATAPWRSWGGRSVSTHGRSGPPAGQWLFTFPVDRRSSALPMSAGRLSIERHLEAGRMTSGTGRSGPPRHYGRWRYASPTGRPGRGGSRGVVRDGLAWLAGDLGNRFQPGLVLDALRPVSAHLHGMPESLRLFVDAQLLISAQTTSREANALYGASALDLPRRGVVHVQGGMGAIADTLVDSVRKGGGGVHFR